jgi:hypothetical protein
VATYTTRNLADGALATAALTDLFTVDTGKVEVIKALSICNPTGGVVLCTLKLVPRTAGTARTLVSARALAPGETYVPPGVLNQALEAGGKVQMSGLALEYVLTAQDIVQ